jgi:hypothetical protein
VPRHHQKAVKGLARESKIQHISWQRCTVTVSFALPPHPPVGRISASAILRGKYGRKGKEGGNSEKEKKLREDIEKRGK